MDYFLGFIDGHKVLLYRGNLYVFRAKIEEEEVYTIACHDEQGWDRLIPAKIFERKRLNIRSQFRLSLN